MRSTSPFLQLPQGSFSPQCLILPTSLPLPVFSSMGKQLKFAHRIASTSLHPDMIITSEALKHLIILGLTVPWDDCIKEVNKRKPGTSGRVQEQRLEDILWAHSPKLAAEDSLDAHSARSSLGWALRKRPRRRPFNPQGKTQRKPIGGFGWRLLIHG